MDMGNTNNLWSYWQSKRLVTENQVDWYRQKLECEMLVRNVKLKTFNIFNLSTWKPLKVHRLQTHAITYMAYQEWIIWVLYVL